MKQFDKVKATYKPKVTEDLKEEAKIHIGKVYEFEAMWVIEKDYCDGKYEGQWSMHCEEMRHWSPEEDLEILSFQGGIVYTKGLAILHDDCIVSMTQADKFKKTFSEIDFSKELPKITPSKEQDIELMKENLTIDLKEKLLSFMKNREIIIDENNKEEYLIKLNPKR